MILVVPDQDGPAVQRFVGELHRGAAVLTPEDLCTPGWSFDPADPGEAVVVAGGIRRRVADLEAVVCALPQVTADLLPMVDAADRAYAAAELTALALAVLATATCPVLNPPRDGCLSGPGWAPEVWADLARRHDIPTWPLRRTAWPEAVRSGVTDDVAEESVTVCGTHVAGGNADPVLVERARRLAHASGVPLLTACFRRRDGVPLLTGVLPWPDLAVPGLACAVDRYLDAGAA